jgi:pre-peptidase
LIRGLLSYGLPRTYEQILGQVDSSQVALVTGEHDNTFAFVPAPAVVPALPIIVRASVAKSEEKHVAPQLLVPGTYTVTLAHDPAAPGGDADLYVRIGNEPSTVAYDCRPYKNSSDESCQIRLSAPAQLFTMVRGYAAGQSAYILTIAAEGGM